MHITTSNNCNPRFCSICSHENRAEMETAILSISPSNPSFSIEAIAESFGVGAQELRIHALMHTPLALDFSSKSESALVENFKLKAGATSPQTSNAPPDYNSATSRQRITDLVNMREGDMLMAVANEYLTTITSLGRRIKRYATDNSEGSDQRLVNFCSKPITDLYIGTGAELRKAIEGIRELNASINGEHDAGADGLKALGEALAGISVKSTDEKATEPTL